ncbi:MAG: excinuclease ABC subunit UvrC [Alphaproteobacteria bacterium]
MEESNTPLAAGRHVIKRYVQQMHTSPGVYRMLDAKGETLYIGKAKNLKARVSNYTQAEAMNARLQRMISQVAAMEITSTRSEAEALLLEANQIKKYQPRYNILLKDDKSFPYIFFSGDHAYSRISKHRGAKSKKGKYYGPFVSAHAVNEMLTLLQKAFLLRPCSDNVFKNRSRPCLQYQIKRCSAPCVNKISEEDYADLVSQAQAFLSGRNQEVREHLVGQMQAYSLKLQYEKARIIRDRIRAITQVQQQNMMDIPIGDADVLVVVRKNEQACVLMFAIRSGRNYGSRTWFPARSESFSEEEILENFIGQFYQRQPPPHTILINKMIQDTHVLEEALRLQADHKVEVVHPLRGDKRQLIDLAERNAKEALQRHLAVHATQHELLEAVQKLFRLEDSPQRIEVYDNSHISGTNAVGCMIVAGPEGFNKNEYRKFNIKQSDIIPGDDYGMMREVLTRRFKRMQETEEAKVPDLVLIDGGAGQLSAAGQIFEELGIDNVPYVAISKGEDRNAGREFFHMPGKKPFQLEPNDPVLHYLQRLRDEAHRFAIGTHRSKRAKSMQASELDSIPSVGPARKKALLQYFGSVRAIAAASQDDLLRVEGISKSMAQLIYDHFHGA